MTTHTSPPEAHWVRKTCIELIYNQLDTTHALRNFSCTSLCIHNAPLKPVRWIDLFLFQCLPVKKTGCWEEISSPRSGNSRRLTTPPPQSKKLFSWKMAAWCGELFAVGPAENRTFVIVISKKASRPPLWSLRVDLIFFCSLWPLTCLSRQCCRTVAWTECPILRIETIKWNYFKSSLIKLLQNLFFWTYLFLN